MSRAEFIEGFTKARRASYERELKAGRMRKSEAIMGLADAPKDAIGMWRRMRASLTSVSAADFFKS